MKYKLYEKTTARLARGGVKDPTAQIIALAEEIELYRAKITGLEARLGLHAESARLEWDESGPDWVCPVCGYSCDDPYYLDKFCPGCGVRLYFQGEG